MSSVRNVTPDPDKVPAGTPRHRRGRFSTPRKRQAQPSAKSRARAPSHPAATVLGANERSPRRDASSDVPDVVESTNPEPEPTPEPEPVTEPAPEQEHQEGPDAPNATHEEMDPAADQEAAEAEDDAAASARAATGSGARAYHAKRGSDSLAPIALLAALACAGVLGRQAYLGEITEDLGLSIGLTVAAVALLIYAVRITNSSTIVHLDDRGTLKITVGENRHVFDLANTGTELEHVGDPDTRGWKILVLRRTMSPVVVDASMVDPSLFTQAVRQWRPKL